jgi:class 3 adenylate cyclase
VPEFSLGQFAALVSASPEQVGDWAAIRLLDPAGTGHFDELDLARVMTIRRYEALGYAPQALADAIASGEIEPFLGEYLYPRGPQLSLEEAAERIGLDPVVLRGLRTALGFRRDTFLDGDLELLNAFKVITAAGMPLEAAIEGARVMGDALRRLAESEIRLVHVHIHERLRGEGLSEEEALREGAPLQDAVIPLLDGMVQRMHHEHLLYADIEDAYVHLAPSDAASGRGSVETTIAFIDLASFTSLAETEGDQAAMELVTRLDAIVRALVLDHDGKVVKHIGDELMLAFRRAVDAVRFAAALDEQARRDPDIPVLRTGMHAGRAIYRGGDYLGTTVNVAARVTDVAAVGETLVTEAVAREAADGAALEPVGVRMLRGAAQPLQLYRLAREEQQRDPVCGEIVDAPPAARLREGDSELWFCSQRCLREFLTRHEATA